MVILYFNFTVYLQQQVSSCISYIEWKMSENLLDIPHDCIIVKDPQTGVISVS